MSKAKLVALFLSFSLIIPLLFSFPMNTGANGTSLVYTAIGDSIAAGYRLPKYTSDGKTTEGAYVALFGDEIGATKINDKAISGSDTSDTLKLLDNSAYAAAISEADVITLSMGSNDLLGPGQKYNVVLALGLVFIPSFARVTRTAFAAARDVNYIKSARLMGASSSRILLVHILPNTMNVLLPAITIGFNNAVLAEASMSYLGIGVTPPDASLGYMLSEAQGMFAKAPWYALCTGAVIVLFVFGVGLIGEGLQRRGTEVE